MVLTRLMTHSVPIPNVVVQNTTHHCWELRKRRAATALQTWVAEWHVPPKRCRWMGIIDGYLRRQGERRVGGKPCD